MFISWCRMGKPIEFTIPCNQLCSFEEVKNFTRLDGSKITFIEKAAYDELNNSYTELDGDMTVYQKRVHELEAKYAKAVEGLKKLSKFGEGTHGSRKCSSWHSLDDMQIELNERMGYAEQLLLDLGEL